MGWPTGRRPGDDPEAPEAGTGHHPLLGQPHDELREGPIGQAESVAAGTHTAREPLGAPGTPFNWRSPFLIGVSAAAGVALTYSAVQLLLAASQALLLVTLSLFLAIGLEPAVSWMVTRGIPRWAGVTTVLGTVLAFIAAFRGDRHSAVGRTGQSAGRQRPGAAETGHQFLDVARAAQR